MSEVVVRADVINAPAMMSGAGMNLRVTRGETCLGGLQSSTAGLDAQGERCRRDLTLNECEYVGGLWGLEDERRDQCRASPAARQRLIVDVVEEVKQAE